MLVGRTPFLKFNDHTSKAIQIDNGIGQGDPLSMVLYQFYNADILDILTQPGESASTYIDDALILAVAPNFKRTHQIISDMISREGGIYDWSLMHNSPLEHSKLALVDFTHVSSAKERPVLILPDATITLTASTRYLGVMIDQHLNWKAQHTHVIGKGTTWASQIRRIARPSWGMTPKYARMLFNSVALPKLLYRVDI